MTTALVVLGLIAVVAIVAAVVITRELLDHLEAQEQRYANERHTLTNRIQAPQMVPVSGASGHRLTHPPKDADALASIGTVRHRPPSDG